MVNEDCVGEAQTGVPTADLIEVTLRRIVADICGGEDYDASDADVVGPGWGLSRPPRVLLDTRLAS